MNAEQPGIGHTLHARSLQSVFWLTVQNGLTAILLVAIPALLAHVLTPEDMGLLEISLAFFGLATLFTELGTGPAIIQRPLVDDTFLSTVFLVNVATGLLLGLTFVAAAPAMAGWLRMDDRLIPIVRCVGLTLIPLSTAIVPRNLLAKSLLFRRITLADVVAGASATLMAAIGLRRGGLETALIRGFAAYGIVVTLVLWSGARWWPRARPEPRVVWPLLKFSLSVSGSRMVENLTLQSDRFLIGRYLGAAALGFFGLARTLVRVPLRFLLNVSDEVLLSGLAALQTDRPRAREYYLTALRIELAILGPAVVFAAVFAREFSDLLFGSAWSRAAFVAQLLAIAGWRNVTGHTTGAVLLSHGRPDLQLRWTTYALVLSVIYFAAGRPWGLEGVAAAAALLETGGWALRHTMANRLLELDWRRFATALAPLWAAHAVLLLWTLGTRHVLLAIVPSEAARIAIALPIAALAYLAILRVAVPGLPALLRRGATESVTLGLRRPSVHV